MIGEPRLPWYGVTKQSVAATENAMALLFLRCLLPLLLADADAAPLPWPTGLKVERLATLPPRQHVAALAATSSHLVWLEQQAPSPDAPFRVRGLKLAAPETVHTLTADEGAMHAVAIDSLQTWLMRGTNLYRLPLPGQQNGPARETARFHDGTKTPLLAEAHGRLWFFTAEGALHTSTAGAAAKVHSAGYHQPLALAFTEDHGLLVLEVNRNGQARLLQPVPEGDFGARPRRGPTILDDELETHRHAGPARPALPPLAVLPAEVRGFAWLPARRWPEPWGGHVLLSSTGPNALRLLPLPEANSPPRDLIPFLVLPPDRKIAALTTNLAGELFVAVESSKGTDLLRVRPASWVDGDEPDAELQRLEQLGAGSIAWNQEERSFCLRQLREGSPLRARLAAELLGSFAAPDDREVEAALTNAAATSDRRLRRTAALALGGRSFPGAADTLLNELRGTDPADAFLLEGWVRGLERLGTSGVERLLDLADSGREADREKAIAAFDWVRSPAGWSVLPRLLANVHLSEDQLTRLLSSAAHLPGKNQQAAELLRGWLEAHPGGPLSCRLAALNGLAELNALKTAATQDLLRDWLRNEEDADARAALLAAVELAAPPGMGPLLAEQLGSRGRAPLEQRRVLRTIAKLRVKEALPSVRALAQSKDARLIHADCWATLAQLEPEETARQATAAVATAEPALQPELARVAVETAEGAIALGRLLEQGKLPPSLKAAVLAGLQRHAKESPAAADLARRLAK